MAIKPAKSLLLTALLSALAGIPQAQAATRGFFSAKPVPAADQDFAKKILIGDFNNDRKPDFATLHWEKDNRAIVNGVNYEKGFLVRVYLNTTPSGSRDSSFQLSAELPYIHGEYRMYDVWDNDMTLDDVNNDGKLDIVVANAHNDVIETYLGKGNGQFNLPVESVVDDDPTYIATGHFATNSGLKQLYIQHYKRNDWSYGQYNIFSSIYQFNADGTLTKINYTLDDTTGNWLFPDGPYYAYRGNNFTTTVPKNSVILPSASQTEAESADGLDVVIQNVGSFSSPLWIHSVIGGGLIGKFWTDTASPDKYADQIKGSGYGWKGYFHAHLTAFYSANAHAFNGAITLKTMDAKDKSWHTAEYDGSLNPFVSIKLLANDYLSPGSYGSAILRDDFDKDGQIDLMLLSDVPPSSDSPGLDEIDGTNLLSNTEQSILVAYSNNADQHPLNVDSTVGFDTNRIKILTNASGRWPRGLHDWHWALEDFNGDGYKDLITLTDNGVMVHTNYGNFAQEAIPPVLNDISMSTIKSGATLTLHGDFRTGDRLANWVELTDSTMGRPTAKYLLAADPASIPEKITDPVTQMNVIIPADKIKPGTYELRVTNTLARSFRIFTLTVQ